MRKCCAGHGHVKVLFYSRQQKIEMLRQRSLSSMTDLGSTRHSQGKRSRAHSSFITSVQGCHGTESPGRRGNTPQYIGKRRIFHPEKRGRRVREALWKSGWDKEKMSLFLGHYPTVLLPTICISERCQVRSRQQMQWDFFVSSGTVFQIVSQVRFTLRRLHTRQWGFWGTRLPAKFHWNRGERQFDFRGS